MVSQMIHATMEITLFVQRRSSPGVTLYLMSWRTNC